MDSLNNKSTFNNSTNVNPFKVLQNNNPKYLINRFSHNLWNALPSVTSSDNLSAKQNDIQKEISKVELTTNYFKNALEAGSTKTLDFMG